MPINGTISREAWPRASLPKTLVHSDWEPLTFRGDIILTLSSVHCRIVSGTVPANDHLMIVEADSADATADRLDWITPN